MASLEVEDRLPAHSRRAEVPESPRFSSIAALLVATAMTLGAWSVARVGLSAPLAIVGALVLCVGAFGAVRLARIEERGLLAAWRMLSLLSPTALLMTVFPFIINEINSIGQGMLILSVSATIPWITSATIMPMYAPMRAKEKEGEASFFYRFYQLIPVVGAVSLLLVALVSGGVVAHMHFGANLATIYVVGVITNIIFSFSLVPVQEKRRYGAAILAWALYAGVIFLFPHLWFIAPLVGSAPGVAISRTGLSGILRPRGIEANVLFKLVLWGLLYGCVLWADKFLIILRQQEQASILALYLSLVPVVVAQAVYFSSQSDNFDARVGRMWTLIDEAPARVIDAKSARLFVNTDRDLRNNFLLTGVLAVGMLFIMPRLGISPSYELLAFVVTPQWLQALMISTQQLNQLKGVRLPGVICLIHLVVLGLGMVFLHLVTALFVTVCVDLLLLGWAQRATKQAFVNSAFDLFWKQAVVW